MEKNCVLVLLGLENEGDLIFSAHNMTINQMPLMIRKCSGIVCLCLTNEKDKIKNLTKCLIERTVPFNPVLTIAETLASIKKDTSY